MGIEELARFGSVLGIDVAGAFGFASSLETLPVRGRRGSVASMFREGLPKLGVDELGQRRGVGLVTDVPGLQPREFRVAGSRAGFRHFRQTGIDRIGQNRSQQKYPILCRIATFQMRKMLRETCPGIDFEKQLSDLDVW